jgi:3-deoxy-7-phosphoheptulonate synthase
MITPNEIYKKLPNTYIEQISVFKNDISNILLKKDNRFLVIVGPCSVHNTEEVLEYAKELKFLKESFKDKIYIVMRVYGEKPRSSGKWTGYINDPNLDDSNDIEKGLINYRKLCLEISKLNIPIASEMLCPITFNYFKDLISFTSVGARTSESQIHRNYLSNLEIPCSIKNDMKGDIEVAVQGISMINKKHIFLNINNNGIVEKFESKGNFNNSIILRGSLLNGPNYEKNFIETTDNLFKKYDLNKYVIIDCSHGNSQKNYKNQLSVIENIIEQKKDNNTLIIGIMIESFINEGNQPISNSLNYGISITDSCISLKDTTFCLNKLYLNI